MKIILSPINALHTASATTQNFTFARLLCIVDISHVGIRNILFVYKTSDHAGITNLCYHRNIISLHFTMVASHSSTRNILPTEQNLPPRIDYWFEPAVRQSGPSARGRIRQHLSSPQTPQARRQY